MSGFPTASMRWPTCYDYRMPGKKDDVSFAVTRLDMERGVAVGIITRIIRQNL